MSAAPMQATRYALRQSVAADGGVLHDVFDASVPTAPTLYRSPDRAHAQSVADDLAHGVLDPAAVHSLYVELIASGWHRPVGRSFGGWLPWPWQRRAPADNLWQRAARRIEALRDRTGHARQRATGR